MLPYCNCIWNLFKLPQDVISFVHAPHPFRSFADKVVLWRCFRQTFQTVDRLVTWWGAEVKLTPLILLIWKQRMSTRDMDIISTGYRGKTKEGRNYHVDKISLLFPVMDLLFCFPPLHLWPAEQHFQIFFTDYIWALFSYKCFVTSSCWLKTTSCNFKGVILILIALHLSFGKGLAPFK